MPSTNKRLTVESIAANVQSADELEYALKTVGMTKKQFLSYVKRYNIPVAKPIIYDVAVRAHKELDLTKVRNLNAVSVRRLQELLSYCTAYIQQEFRKGENPLSWIKALQSLIAAQEKLTRTELAVWGVDVDSVDVRPPTVVFKRLEDKGGKNS